MFLEMTLDVIKEFSMTTGLVVNLSKFRIYCDGVDIEIKQRIHEVSSYVEGQLPVRYLGVPLTDKKFNIKHYLHLIDRIMARIKHCTSTLLSTTGGIQMVKCTITVIVQFWMQSFLIPKSVIHKIDSMCRSFIWTGSTEPSRKNPVACGTICRPKR